MKLALTTILILLSLYPSGLAAFLDALEGKLVKLDPDSGELRPHELADAPGAKYFMIYFSAHWCPPCRKRTPILVSFYNEAKAENPGFEFIFVSNDRSEKAMEEYMRWAEMPWPAVAWEQRSAIPAIAELNPPAIPFMAMFDREGRLLGASDLGGFNVGIPTLINGLQKKLGIETYDLDERHRKTSPFILITYALGGGFLAVYLIRRRFRRAPPEV